MTRFLQKSVRSTFILLSLAGLGTAGASAETITSFHVGNSLTWDTRPRAFPKLSDQRNIDHEAGFFIRSSRSLTQIAEQPGLSSEISGPTGDNLTQLGDRSWDVVSLQTYPNSATLQSEASAAAELIDLTRSFDGNDDTRFILYGGWPGRSGSYADAWNRGGTITAETAASSTDAFQRAFHQEVKDLRPDAEVQLLSIGRLLALVDEEIRTEVAAGSTWLGYTDIGQLYRDPIHLNNEGRWLASIAMWAATTGGSLDGLSPTPGDYGDSSARVYQDAAFREATTAFVTSTLPSILVVPEPTTAAALGVLLMVSTRRRRSA